MSTYIELEIQQLLNEDLGPGQVCDRLIQNLENFKELLTPDNITSLSRFLFKSEQPLKLVQFILRHVDDDSFPIPWPYFLEALGILSGELDEKTIEALTEGIRENKAEPEAARSSALNQSITSLGEWRSSRKYKIHKDYLDNKRLLLDQMITLRTQQLYEQEKVLLERLQKLYPGDSDIKKEISEHKQRNALDVLQRRSPKARTIKEDDFAPKDPEVENARLALMQSLLEHAELNPRMALDFAIIAFILESYEESLSLLSFAEESISLYWFRLEILLRCRRFVEVLNEAAKIEILLVDDPETFFATAYSRAQAMWGLGQKHTAIEILESILAARPNYRAAATILSIWRGA